MYLRNKGNISLNKTRKLKRRRQNGGARGARGARRVTIGSIMNRIATSISPQSLNMFSRKRSKASSKASRKVSPEDFIDPKQQRNSVSGQANSAELTTVEELIRKAAALSAETKRLIQQNETIAAETEQIVSDAMDDANTISRIMSGTQSEVDKSDDEDEDDDDALMAKLEEELAEEELTGKKLSKLSRKEEKELAKLISGLSPQDQRALGIPIPTSNGGRITRKQKKSRTRRRHKKSRKY
jgi:hypothetical protein